MARIISRKNSVQLGQNFQNQLPDKLARSDNLTSNQVERKIKIPLLSKLVRSQKTLRRNLRRSRESNFDTGCVEVKFSK